MEKYIYIRVSDKSQNEARQLADVTELNIPAENVFIDKQSGKDFDRPEYQKLMSQLNEGDIVYFHSIDRLGRNYEQIIENWNKITKEIKADIIILDMPLLDTTVKQSDLTGKFIADLVLQILSYVAEKGRENIVPHLPVFFVGSQLFRISDRSVAGRCRQSGSFRIASAFFKDFDDSVLFPGTQLQKSASASDCHEKLFRMPGSQHKIGVFRRFLQDFQQAVLRLRRHILRIGDQNDPVSAFKRI